MTYKTKCKADGSCVDRIDSQAETIKAYQDEINRLRSIEDPHSVIERQAEIIKRLQAKYHGLKKIKQWEDEDKKEILLDRTSSLIKASERITQLEAENSNLKERIRKLERRQPVVLREDANWDSRPREESWEL